MMTSRFSFAAPRLPSSLKPNLIVSVNSDLVLLSLKLTANAVSRFERLNANGAVVDALSSVNE
ncbi:hypothetical protein D3C71_1917680 [compost metagenome]